MHQQASTERRRDKTGSGAFTSSSASSMNGSIEIGTKSGSYRIPSIAIFAACCLFFFTTYGLMLRLHFSVDSYGHIYEKSSELFLAHTSGGRIVSGVVTYILSSLGYQIVLNQAYGTAYFILTIALSAYLLIKRVLARLGDITVISAAIVFAIIVLPFTNVFFLELFLFPEADIIAGTGIFLAVLAAILLDSMRNIKGLILSFVLLMLAINLYQIFLEIFIVYSIIFVLIDGRMECTKRSFVNGIIVVAIALVSAVCSIIASDFICRILNIPLNPRSATLEPAMILNNIKNLVKIQLPLWKTAFNMLPTWTPAAFGTLLFAALGVAIARSKQKKPLNVFIWILILVCAYLLSFAPHFISKIFWPAQRTIFMFFSVFSLVAIMIYLLTNSKGMRYFLLLLSVLFLFLNVFQIQQISADAFIKDSLDKETAKELVYAVEKHEKETGLPVVNIGMAHGEAFYQYNQYSYSQWIYHDVNVTARYIAWSNPQYLRYYTGRSFHEVPMDQKIYDQYFSGKSWDVFDAQKQVVFVGDTVYVFFY